MKTEMLKELLLETMKEEHDRVLFYWTHVRKMKDKTDISNINVKLYWEHCHKLEALEMLAHESGMTAEEMYKYYTDQITKEEI